MAEVSGGPSLGEVQALMAASVPQPATVTPRSEMTGGAIGVQPTRFALEDHQHPRLTSTTAAMVTTGSTATLAFTRPFLNKPGVVCTEIEGATGTAAQPAVFKVDSWVTDANGAYTGCVIRVWRSQTVPQNLATLLLGAVFNLFSASVVGTQFSCIAVARSDVSAA
jgi:hypothetical protein